MRGESKRAVFRTGTSRGWCSPTVEQIIRLKSLRKVETFDKMCLHEATWTPPLGGGGGLSEIRDLRDFSDKTRDLSFLDEICLILFDSVLF